jgi:hypothetical protein
VALKRGFAPVAFDELAWQDDLRKASKGARRIGEETRSRLDREGQAVDALFACDEDARDGTSLPGCVKVYIPPPGGPLGLVYRLAKNKDAASISTISPSASDTTHRGPLPSPSTSWLTDAYISATLRRLPPSRRELSFSALHCELRALPTGV